MGVEEFIRRKRGTGIVLREEAASKSDLTYTQIDKINKELKEIWLK